MQNFASFDFSFYEDLVKTDSNQTVSFYETVNDAINETNPILNTSNYIANSTPKEIHIRIENGECYSFNTFLYFFKCCLARG